MTACLYGTHLCGRSSYARGGCRGEGCVAANASYMAVWRRRPAEERGRRRIVKAPPKRRKPSTSHPDIQADPILTVPLGTFVRSELRRAATEGFSPEYVAWLERTAGRMA